MTGSASAAETSAAPRAVIGPDEYYINYAEPEVQPDTAGREVKGRDGVYAPALDAARAFDRKHAGGNPVTARELAKVEAKSLKTGKNPRKIKQAPSTQTAKLLTLLVEFNDQANDDFTNVRVPKTVFEDRTCVFGTVQNGPKHNNIPNPAKLGYEDNNSMWVPDFSPAHYDKMLYTKTGITERVRKDLKVRTASAASTCPAAPCTTCTGDVEGRVHGGRAGQPVDHRAALGGLVRGEPLLPGPERQLGRRP
ncbi:hypothetical protein [Micromonospora sp. URMC 103]|uniref:hypothetical protein n=1 Tax=Micromonospora sp. URMC 103 TaxID=3423406 RepID=UPI003F1D4CFC